jgi:hypothetical protein
MGLLMNQRAYVFEGRSIMTKLMKSSLSWLLAAVMVISPFTAAQAGMISTQQMLESTQTHVDRDQIRQFIDRESTRQQLVEWGVSADDAKARISNLTDAEVARINQAIDDSQAGSGILEIILIVFLAFVNTDIIGATDIFPFINAAK